MLVRLAYLAVSNALTVLRQLPMSDRNKDIEILTLRHQISVLQRQLGATGPDSNPQTGRFWPPYSRHRHAKRYDAYS